MTIESKTTRNLHEFNEDLRVIDDGIREAKKRRAIAREDLRLCEQRLDDEEQKLKDFIARHKELLK